jgi:hypothetical protein
MRNFLIKPFFFGPRQITASSRFGNMNCTLMTPRFSLTHTGSQPSAVTWIVSSSTPIIFGIDGPQMSVSIRPTVEEGFDAKPCESIVLNVLFPTPPLPLRTRILCCTEARRAVMMGMSGSGPFGAEAHIAWLGQPAQLSALPAWRDSGPGQCSAQH